MGRQSIQQVVRPLHEVVMSVTKLSPRYNVVSLRVSNEELEDVRSLVLREQTTISELLRDALNVVRSRCQGAHAIASGATQQKLEAGCLH